MVWNDYGAGDPQRAPAPASRSLAIGRDQLPIRSTSDAETTRAPTARYGASFTFSKRSARPIWFSTVLTLTPSVAAISR